jgi:hypothetical protein
MNWVIEAKGVHSKTMYTTYMYREGTTQLLGLLINGPVNFRS